MDEKAVNTLVKGNLYLIPTTLGDCEPTMVLPAGTTSVLQSLDYLIVEQVRTARRLLSRLHLSSKIDSIQFFELNKHSSPFEVKKYLHPALSGASVGLLSEAGTPCIADPGAVVVAHAHELGIRVVPLTGPSSIILALMASGFNGQSFAFHGYLPIQTPERILAIKHLENLSITHDQTQIFIETPFRNLSLFETLIKTCQAATMLCLATDISLETEYIQSMPVKDWKKMTPDIQKRPTVYLIYGQKK
jgi:16S rRNA (cytidine1402-2'-O)-methyltransferase